MPTPATYQWPKDWAQVKTDFIQTFHLPIGDYYDPLLSYAMQKFTIDIVKLDDLGMMALMGGWYSSMA